MDIDIVAVTEDSSKHRHIPVDPYVCYSIIIIINILIVKWGVELGRGKYYALISSAQWRKNGYYHLQLGLF